MTLGPLHRIPLRPRSPWRTPWQADTLTGALLATCARTHGPAFLRSKLIDPMLAGAPPFVLSDAMPGDLLPFPLHFRLHRYPPGTDFKALKRARWLPPEAFHTARAGQGPPFDAMLTDAHVFLDTARHHNTLSRLTDTSTAHEQDEDSAIGLYQKPETLLLAQGHADHLTLYFRFANHHAADLLLDLLHELSFTGFGADTSTGRGQFDLPDDPRPVPDLDTPPDRANGVLCFSSFQPGPGDPVAGCWDAFAKFPRVGPDIAVNDKQQKNTLILFRPGAVFHADPATTHLGHAIDTIHLFPHDTARSLLDRNLRIIHPAFGLTIPTLLPEHHP